MGGQQAGEVASALVVESLRRSMASQPGSGASDTLLEQATLQANREVWQAAHYPGAAAGGSAGLDVKELLAEVRVWSARQSALAWSATTEARRTELLERMPLIRLPD